MGSFMSNRRNNARYRGNAIGNAQNFVIRNILSNLGYESFSEKDWEETKVYFDNRCAYCGSEDNIVCDHAIPINRSKLGEHRLGNLVPACKECNSKKGERDYIEFCNDNENVLTKIKKYMDSRGYVPITNDELKSDNVQIVLQKAHEEIRFIAARYIDLINGLFFDDLPDDDVSQDDSLQNTPLAPSFHRVNNEKPKREFILKGIPCDSNRFEQYLRSNPCNVKVTLLYEDRQPEIKIWKQENFKSSTRLSGNISSGFLRKWREKGIIGIKLEIQ
jgi:hypothetical protein